MPITAGELCDYLHFLQWMAHSLPYFTKRIGPMKEILEEAYKRAGSRTKKAEQRIRLDALWWDSRHKNTYKEFQMELRNLVKLAHRDTAKALCVYTDAPDAHCSGCLRKQAVAF